MTDQPQQVRPFVVGDTWYACDVSQSRTRRIRQIVVKSVGRKWVTFLGGEALNVDTGTLGNGKGDRRVTSGEAVYPSLDAVDEAVCSHDNFMAIRQRLSFAKPPKRFTADDARQVARLLGVDLEGVELRG